MPITAFHYLGLSATLFSIGLLGLCIHRHHLIQLLICIEVLLLAINTQFVAVSYYAVDLSAQILVFFILAVTAAEMAVALAILILLFRERQTVILTQLNQLKG